MIREIYFREMFVNLKKYSAIQYIDLIVAMVIFPAFISLAVKKMGRTPGMGDGA